MCYFLGSFNKGIAEGEVEPSFGPLEALRLSIQTDSPVWVILSEVCSIYLNTSASVKPGSHICGHDFVPGVQCASVHWFRCKSGLIFCLNSHLNLTQRYIGPFFKLGPWPPWACVNRLH